MKPKTQMIEKTLAAGVLMDPSDFVGAFKEAGFRFESESCPIRFKQPFQRILNPDGSTTFQQMIAVDEGKEDA